MSNISRKKGNQTIKFGQFIEYKMRKKTLKNHAENVVEKLVLGLFIKNQN